MDFALEVGAITKTEKQQLEERNENALNELVERQAKYQLGSDPAALFVCFLRAALVRGIAHVADRTGGMPPDCGGMGLEMRTWRPALPFRKAPVSVGSAVMICFWTQQSVIVWFDH